MDKNRIQAVMGESVLDGNRIQAINDKASHRIAGRLMNDVDLMGGIKEVCAHFKVEAAHFQCFGSLRHATFVQAERGEKEGTLRYSEKVKSDSAVELLSGSGFVGFGEDGNLDVHFHGMMIDCDKQLNGGHFLDGENPVAVTVEFIIFPLSGIELRRGRDPHWGMPVFQFREKE